MFKSMIERLNTRVKNRRTLPPEASKPTAPDPYSVGLTDNVKSGWYCNEGEIVEGFKVGENDILLDVGCGQGGHLEFCAKSGAHLIFVDIDPEKVAQTEKRLEKTATGKVEGYVSDANPLPIGDATVSHVICSEVLEHVDNPNNMLSELYRVGKPGAKYFISVPDAASELLLKGIAPDEYFIKPNHSRIFERDKFKECITDVGLVVKSHELYGFYWTLWSLMYWGTCKKDFTPPFFTPPFPEHMDHWVRTWKTLLATEHGVEIKRRLDRLLPKHQVIIAEKPEPYYEKTN